MSTNDSTEPIGARIGSGTSWELIPDPPVVSEEHKHLIPPPTRTHTDQPKLLCGFLIKETTHSLIKTWKQRWVVVDDSRCCLYYYNTKNDTQPQGSIDLSNATFTYSVENMSRNQFEIQTPSCTYSFQAATQEAMFQWLDALKKKRRKYSERGKESGSTHSPQANSSGGLMSTVYEESMDELHNGVVIDSDQPILTPQSSLTEFIRRLPKPNAVVKRLSTANIKTPTDNDKKLSSFYVNTPEEEQTPGDVSAPNSLTDLTKQDETTPINIPTPSNGTTPTNMATPTTNKSWLGRKPNVPDWVKRTLKPYGDSSETCSSCEKREETIEKLQHDLKLREQEVKDRDEMLDFLRREIRLSELETKVRQELTQQQTSDTKVDVITQRDQIITSLQKTLESLKLENDRIETELLQKRDQCVQLSEEVTLYKETLAVKDQVVIDLTNKMFSLETGGQLPNNPQDAMMPTTTKMLELEIDKLKETVDAYKQQNVFLSQEIMEMNSLRESDANERKQLTGQLHEQEAELIRLKTKYVILLKEAPKNSHDSDVVSQMMQEAISEQETAGSRDRSSSDVQYDAYGFKHDTEASPDETLDSYAKRLDQQALQNDENTVSHVAKWDNFMAQFAAGRELVISDELKLLIRGGIPRQYKGRIWKFCIRRTIQHRYIPGFYSQILADNAGQTSVALSQIELDLLRTLPSNKYYNKPGAPGIPKLRRVLVAYSWYDTAVGYCQGLNRLAAIALLFLEEEDAFWCLVAVVLHLLPPDYYNRTLLGSQTDQRVLRDFISDKMAALGAHLATCDIDFSLITFNWFHTLFIDNLPIGTTLRIWDTFLFEGSKVLFRYAMAIFKYNEEDLLDQDNSIKIFNKLRTMAQGAVDVNKLTQIAFYDPMMRNFSKKKINQRRDHYRAVIEAELFGVDEQRTKHYTSTGATNQRRDTPNREYNDSDDEL